MKEFLVFREFPDGSFETGVLIIEKDGFMGIDVDGFFYGLNLFESQSLWQIMGEL